MPHNSTDLEKAKVSEYLAEKADLEKRGRGELEEVEAGIAETDVKYLAFHNARNPVLTLPVEVICLIFSFAQLPSSGGVFQREETSEESGEEEEEGEEKKEKYEYAEEEEEEIPMEIVVSHVCRRWRSISLGFSTLWTTFSYEAKDSAVDVQQALQRLDIYLERSAALPLRIWFDFQPARSHPDNAQLVEKALHHAHRWQHFTIYSDDVTVMNPLHLLQDISAPMLEYLTLVPGVYSKSLFNSYSKITSMDPCVLKGGAPKLTYLMLGGLAAYSVPPLSNITILRIEERERCPSPMFELAPFLELLSLPSLNRLSLSGNLVQPFVATRAIYMPNLKSFRVAAFDAIWNLLASIRAPQLDTLILHMWLFHPRINIIPSLDNGYVFPALNTLCLLGFNFGPLVVPSLTRMTSQATHVILSDSNIRTILDCFPGATWPQLKTLTYNIETVAPSIDDCVTFVKNHSKDSITVRILPRDLKKFNAELEALRMVSSVVGECWHVDEPFWPDDIDSRSGPNCLYAPRCFRTDKIYRD